MAQTKNQAPPTHAGRAFPRWLELVLRGLRPRRSRRSMMAAAGILSAVVIGLGVAWSLLDRPARKAPSKAPAPIDEALRKLDMGDYEGARRLATQLRSSDMSFEELGGPVFVLGAIMYHDAEEHWNPSEQKKLFLIASRYLEEARDRSFPPGREAQGLLLLGRAMFHGGRFADCRAVMQQAIRANPDHRSELHYLLAQAYMRDEPPQPDKALPHLEEYLADRTLEPVDRLQGLVLRSAILIHQADLPKARQALDDVERWRQAHAPDPMVPLLPAPASRGGPSVSRRMELLLRDADVLTARWLLARAASEADPEVKRKLYAQARDKLLPLSAQALDTAESEYLLGVLYRRLDEPEAAREQLQRATRRYFGSPEGYAGLLELAEVDFELGNDAEALDALEHLLEDVRDPATYVIRWLPLDDLRRRVLEMYNGIIERREFAQAEQVVRVLHPLIPEDQATELAAQLSVLWGEYLLRRAETEAYSKSQQTLREASAHFRDAGRTYERLADLHYTSRAYATDLWSSAENYLRGNDHVRAAAGIRKYLRNEPRRNRPRALVMLGEALLPLGEIEAARKSFEQCVAVYPKDPDSYRARIGAARAALEMGDIAAAKQLLIDNLENELLTPSSGEWRDSLFLLGETLHYEGLDVLTRSRDARNNAALDEAARRKAERDLEQSARTFQEAIVRLSEAVQRYPQDPRAIRARYLIAEDYRHRARLPRWKLPFETIESRRFDLARRMRADLETAYRTYDQLVRELDQKQDASELTPIEQAVQRNAYFARAHALFDLGRYQDALAAYSSATNQYQNDPASLEAYQQIAACYRKLGDPAKARGTIEQAKIVINNMPTDVDYSKTTRYSRELWLNLLK